MKEGAFSAAPPEHLKFYASSGCALSIASRFFGNKPRTITYKIGIRNRFSIVDTIIPPNTVVPTE